MSQVGPQLVAAGSALLGVVLTLIATDIRERKKERANDKRVELTRAYERAKWFDSEKRGVYAELNKIATMAQEVLTSAAPRNGGPWVEKHLLESYGALRRLAPDTESVLANIQILGSAAVQAPAQAVADALARSYSELDMAHDLTFRHGEEYTPRGKTLADLPDEPVSLTSQLFDDLDAKRRAFLKAARSDLAPPGA